MLPALRLLRPKQWIKNFILFAALIFSKNLFHPALFFRTLAGFIIFCLFSSCVYIVNDLADREKDRLHPQKKTRPLAAGTITPQFAMGLFVILFTLALVVAIWLDLQFALLGLLYFALMLAYTFRFKKIVIFDLLVIAVGFVIRAISGAVLAGVYFSSWLLLCTFLLALFLALQKRKSEQSYHPASRKILEEYSPAFLNDMLNTVTACTLMSYCLYTLTSEHPALIVTIPVVLHGIFRYQYLSGRADKITETPEQALLTDKPLIGTVLLWVLLCVVILQLPA